MTEKPSGISYEQIEELIHIGQYTSARQKLMAISSRCAEWNYLFGAVLMRLCETEKALIYLSVAAHQNPSSVKYAKALNEAKMNRSSVADRLASRFGFRR